MMKKPGPLIQVYVLLVLVIAMLVMFYDLPPLSVLFFGIAAVALGIVLYRTVDGR